MTVPEMVTVDPQALLSLGDDNRSRLKQITASSGLEDLTIVAAKKVTNYTTRFHVMADLTATVEMSADFIRPSVVVVDEVRVSSTGGITVGVASPHRKLSRSLLDPVEEIAVGFVTRRGDLQDWVTATEQLLQNVRPILERTHAHTDDYHPDHFQRCIDDLVQMLVSAVPMQWAAQQFLNELTNEEMR